MIDTIYSDPHFLAHHGVKGMKWGVRKYQNEDGSLTPEGKKRLKKAFKEDWLDVYNKVADNANNKIGKYNSDFDKRYGEDIELGDNFETKAGQDYVKGWNEIWKASYKDIIKEHYGLNEIKNGEKWCNYYINNYGLFYDQFDDYIK